MGRSFNAMYLDLGAGARYELVPSVSAGLALAAAFSSPPSFEGLPWHQHQLSADLVVQWRPEPAFFDLRFTTNVDEPAGFTFDDGSSGAPV